MQQRYPLPPILLAGLVFCGLLLTTRINAQFADNTASAAPTASATSAASATEAGDMIRSNVPLNEISTRAFRHFRKHFRTVADENWYKSEQGYLVSFVTDACREQAWYHPDGSFMCTERFYSAKELDQRVAAQISREFPGYGIKVVNEITDDLHKTFYLVTIDDPASIKTLMIVDGKIEIRQDLVNGSRG